MHSSVPQIHIASTCRQNLDPQFVSL
jgi:hypothetical protein